MRRAATVALLLAASAALRPATAAVSAPGGVEIAPGISLQLPAGWSEAPRFYRNAHEFVRLPAERQAEAVSADEAAARGSGSWTPRLMVLVEDETSHEAAVRHLADVAGEARQKARAVTYLTVQGWPAVSRRERVELPPRPMSNVRSIPAWVLTTAVAVGNRVVKLEARFPAAASEAELASAAAIGRLLATSSPGNPAAAKQDLARVRAQATAGAPPSARRRSTAPPAPGPPSPPAPPAAPPPAGAGAGTPSGALGAGIFAQSGSETEMAASANGKFVVVASGSATRASADRGQSFPSPSGMPFANLGDPSLAWGQSDTFYLAGIKQNSTCSGGNPTNGCHTGMGRSTDHGQSWNATTDAVTCPVTGAGACFPDQEHIAADRVNAGTGTADQVYVVWRNFTAGPTPSIVCSSDGGNNWSAPVAVDTTGDWPRVTVGGDGSVYVVYATSPAAGTIFLHRYGSCTGGLVSAGTSFLVTAYRGVDCSETTTNTSVPGLDRCNKRNTLASFTAAVDDTNSNHVYVTYANNTATGNENVVVRDSLNSGASWTGTATLNGGVNGRRFMPWSCALGGQLYAGWYDGRNATAGNNDRARYFRGSASGIGGSLTAGVEADVSGADDALCASGWPCAPDAPNNSESCSIQPQLAGICLDGAGNPTNAANPQRCDFDEPPNCPAGFACKTQRGCPKYGDYTGIACGGGMIFFSWASATPPAGVVGAPPAGINTYVSAFKAPGPQIQVPGGIDLGQACTGTASTGTLNVCNTGQTNLVVTAVTSSNPLFSVTAPSSGFPVSIGPGSCFPFQVVFNPPGAAGAQTGNLSIASNDPANPSTTVAVSASVGKPDIRVTGSTDFGVASAWTPAEKTVDVCNTGTCSLAVSTAATSCADFETVTNPFPATLAPGSCLDLVVRFVPHRPGRKVCLLTVASNDPAHPTVTRTLTARTPPAFSLHAGLVEPHGAFHAVAGHGGTLNLDFIYWLDPRWAWDVRLGASRFDGRAGQPDVNLVALSANARFTLNPGGAVHVFVNGGLGVYDFWPGDVVPGGNLGAGLHVPLGHLFALEATYNFHAAFNASPGRELSQVQLGLLVSF